MIAFLADYLLYLMAAAFGLIWLLTENRTGKLTLGLATIIGLIAVLALIQVTAAVYWDPRPFMVDPSVPPLIAHAPDNGFPSDHSAAAGLIAMLMVLRQRWFGAALAAAAVIVAWARVAAHVHHLQDVAAGLALGALAGWIATLLASTLLNRVQHRPRTRPPAHTPSVIPRQRTHTPSE